MDLRLSDEQEQLVASVAGLYARHANSERVREAEASGGFDKALWDQVADLGVVPMAVPAERGGWGATFVDLALAAEQQGRAAAPVPVIEAQVAARLLAALEAPALAGVIDGERIVTIALREARDARAVAVPGAAIADDAIILRDDRLLLVKLEGARAPFANLGAMPLADIDLSAAEVTVLASGAAAVDAYEVAIDEWLCLTAAALVGVAARALELGLEYVKERKAWGVPIGSFQAVAHRMADAATQVDGARLLAFEAAWSVADDPARARELSCMAFGFATEAARYASYWSLHFHGGYGFMLEYDVQLFWRRAEAWAAVWGEPAAAYRRAGDHRYEGSAH